uniref:Nucleotidyltransferase domain-containing protein n=2 Tax=Litorilinea aerophila TaxID=1204385 RepID=A0A540V8D2_9CHLR
MNLRPGKQWMLRQKSSDSVKLISLNQNEVLAALVEIAERIRKDHPDVSSIRVFGSIARGDHVGTSDVDVLIILNRDIHTLTDRLAQIRRFYPYFDLPIGVDLLVYTQDEIDRRLDAGDAFITRIWRESRLLSPS